ncbi:hypothetical protein GQ55_4G069500 [Panicum hallii var. hallii]|uniref:Uncharacterized protein n=2 Tax=Panicum hallii TaxID=206008 RepID=A0A2T7DW17_9POAL|nr:hypothetical protein GQ55_4G069500 [Panicum hallii var. hallii]PVH47463.1 hypothetical protein PAHAL_4G068400 [Panicum hallii]
MKTTLHPETFSRKELLSKWKNARRSRSFGPLANGFCPLALHRDTS